MLIQYLTLITQPFLSGKCTVREALETFNSVPYSTLPVTDEQGVYCGLVALRDIAVRPGMACQAAILTVMKEFPAIQENDSIFGANFSGHYDIFPVVDASGKLRGFITKEQILTMAFRQYQDIAEHYGQILDCSYNGIIAIDSGSRIIQFNRAAERILGCDRNTALGRHISHIDPAMGLQETIVTGKSDIGVKHKINGFTILSNRTPLLRDNVCVGAMAVFVDISDYEKICSELRMANALARELDAIFESSYDGFYICDAEGRVTRVNQAWERVCGFPREFVKGKTAYELVGSGCYDRSAAIEALKTKQTATVMVNITSGAKKGQLVMATGTPIMNGQGEVELVVVNVRDITELEILRARLEATMELSKRYASELEEMRRQHLKFDDMVAQSPAMQRVIELVTRVSQVDSTVLITGESGVGKEVIAKKIHALSRRANRSLIKINCGAIPENLLESELFGYEGGAFTGAKREGKPGMFELASGGTLFLDEIGELPLSLQVKLLRALQEREIIRVGGIKPIPVDVRILTATNKDIAAMVRKGEFRHDLYYRLNVVNIRIPPLRERREDLPPLLHAALHRFNQKYGFNKKLSLPVVESLLQYDWPGNIREVENLIESLVVLVNENNIQIKHLPAFLQDDEKKKQMITLSGIIPYRQALEELEIQLFTRTLEKYGSTRKAAKVLEINQSTVVRKLSQYKIGKTDAELHQSEAWEHQFRI